MNENVLAAIDEELALNARLEAAKSAAINTAYGVAINHCTTHIHGFDAAKSGGAIMQACIQAVNTAFAAIDFVKLLEGAAETAAYRKGFSSVTINAEKVLDNASAEFRTQMAENVLHHIGNHVAARMVDGIDAQLREARRT